ncbi:MAG: hypothetical protein Q9209_001262 [Squamulea sp. 1 TL-2023]
MAYAHAPKEPIAIIGSGCRFPGDSTPPSKLWDLLHSPRDLSKTIPSESRFNANRFYHPNSEHHGSSNVTKSYFLEENPRLFDSGFFSIVPREAEAIDPQQRLLLETVYETKENAGLTLRGLKGSQTFVYAADGYARGEGICAFFMKTLSQALRDGDRIDALIRETCVNSDGRTKGIAIPSAEAQMALIRTAYRNAGLDILRAEDRPQYIEAHVKLSYKKLQIPTTPQEWPSVPQTQPLRASVNGFGSGGTNCHAIMETYVPEIHDHGPWEKPKALRERGAMIVVGFGYEEGINFYSSAKLKNRIIVAAGNSPKSVTLSGDEDAVTEAK